MFGNKILLSDPTVRYRTVLPEDFRVKPLKHKNENIILRIELDIAEISYMYKWIYSVAKTVVLYRWNTFWFHDLMLLKHSKYYNQELSANHSAAGRNHVPALAFCSISHLVTIFLTIYHYVIFISDLPPLGCFQHRDKSWKMNGMFWMNLYICAWRHRYNLGLVLLTFASAILWAGSAFSPRVPASCELYV